MSLLRKFFSAEPAERISDFMNPQNWLTDIGGGQTTSGECVNTRSAMNLAAFFACVQVLSTDIAKLPLKIYKSLKPRGKEVFYEHPLYEVLHDSPNEDMSSMSLREAMMVSVFLRGDGFARIIREGDGAGKPVGLRFIYPDRVDIKNDISKDGIDPGPVYYMVNKQGSTDKQRIASEDMIHIHGVSEDGIRGLSIIKCAAESIGVGLAAQKFGAAFFGNGSTMSGALETPLGLEDTARDNLRSSLDRLHTGAANAHRMLILEEGMKYARIGIPPEEGQFLESRQFTVEDICRWFRMPPHKIQHLLRATFCLPGDSQVYTDGGPVQIKDVKVGDKVWSRTEDNSSWVKSTVSASGCTGTDNVLTIRAGIRTLRCNAKHRVPVRRQVLHPFTMGRGRSVMIEGRRFRKSWDVNFIPAGEIRVGDQLLAANGLGDMTGESSPTRKKCSIEFMEALGMIMGDGYFGGNKSRRTTFGISHGEHDSYLPHYISAIESEFVSCSAPYGMKNGGTVAIKAKTRDKNTTAFYSTHACNELERCGIAGKAKTKTVPSWIFSLRVDLKLAFLRGFLDSDGTVKKNGQITYVSVNKKMLEQVRHLCMSVGVRVGNLYSNEIDSQFNGVPYHHTLFGFCCPHAEDNARIGSHTDFYNDRMDSRIKSRRERISEMYPFESKMRKTVDGVSFTTVRSIERDDTQVEVYDLTVDGTHTFIADGVLVHNSNIEEQSQEYVTDALGGWLIRVEQEFDRKLFKKEKGVFCEHLVNGLLRGNAAARGTFYTQGFGVGLFSANDIREIENMNPVPGGDDYWRPLNLGKLGEEPEPPEPDPVPGPVPPGLEQPQEQDPPEDVPAEDQAPENPPVPPDETAKAALLPVFLDSAARVIRKESAACERACTKYKSNTEAFNLWLDSFFNEDHLGYIVDTFQPTAHALCILTKRTWSPEFKVFKSHISASKELSFNRFHNGQDTIDISDRAGKLSCALVEEICNG